MDNQEIISRYRRAVATQKRRTLVRSIMTGSLILMAVLNFFKVSIFANAAVILYSVMLTYFLYSYVIGRRIGAAKDFRAITEHYLQQDADLNKHIIK